MPLFEAFAPHIKHNPAGLPGAAKRQSSLVEHQRARASEELAHAHAHVMSDSTFERHDEVKSFHFASRTITVSSVIAPSVVQIADRQWYKPEGTFETIVDADGTVTYQSSQKTKIVESTVRGRGERRTTFAFSDGISITQDSDGDHVTLDSELVLSNDGVLTEFYMSNGKKVTLYECLDEGQILKRLVFPKHSVEFRIPDWNKFEVLKRHESGDYTLDRYRAGKRIARWQYYAISHRGVITDDYGLRYYKQNKDGTVTFVDPSGDAAQGTVACIPSPLRYAV